MTTRSLTSITTVPSLGGLVSRLLAWVLDADRRYRAARNLRDLPEHMLEDIGLDRPMAEELSRRV